MTTINRRINTPAEVAALSGEPEGETIDYKGTIDPKQWWELAKDIAAFANHLGGVVLHGAFERNGGTPALRGLPPDEVTELANAYEKVARDRCRPTPLIACTRIPWNDGSEILSVNVQAYAGLVGAQFYASRKDAKDPDGPLMVSAANAWQFPIRVGKDNVALPLEQAIMHMSTHARRTAILLASIPDPNQVKISLRRRDEMHIPWDAALKDVSIERNLANLTLKGSMYSSHAIPLEDIEAVWSGEDGFWYIRISGFFEAWSNAKGEGVTYFPGPPR